MQTDSMSGVGGTGEVGGTGGCELSGVELRGRGRTVQGVKGICHSTPVAQGKN